MKKVFLMLIAASLITATATRTRPVNSPSLTSLRAAKQSALKAGAYLAGYALLKNYVPSVHAQICFRDSPFCFYMPINAAFAAATMAGWHTAQAISHYYNYRIYSRYRIS